ncbi:adhesion G protein-coupled receptor F5-like isoform X3 [Hyperolius riggenbachi]|uniref:adhesion G protein-coupled receptor F5-like isoform X3 n=1 Tax=Hyperolius riggenbachi TaxID=752182 RepID=UPI0035A2B24F
MNHGRHVGTTAIYNKMAGLSTVLFFVCLTSQAALTSLSERHVQPQITPIILQMENQVPLLREKRAASGDPAMSLYTADIEISFSDPSMTEEIRSYLQNMSIYDVLPNTTSIINVTTTPVCILNGTSAVCSCDIGYDCVGTLGACTSTSCLCITSLPLQTYCIRQTTTTTSTALSTSTPTTTNTTTTGQTTTTTSTALSTSTPTTTNTTTTIAKQNITMTPSTVFQNDTATIDCEFSVSGNISWYVNSTKITESEKYSNNSSQQGTVSRYTLKIKNLQVSDNGIAGRETSNTACSIYTLNPSNLTSCSSVTNVTYACKFQRDEGASSSKQIQVRYIKKATISLSPPGGTQQFSVGKPIKITCNIDDGSFSSLFWTIGSNILSNNGLLHAERATIYWEGTYYCVVNQYSLTTSVNVTVNIAPLPEPSQIRVDPVTSYPTNCTSVIPMTCCIPSNSSDYEVFFQVLILPTSYKVAGTARPDLRPNCFNTNLTLDCTAQQTATVICAVNNSLHDTVNSSKSLAITYTTETTKCSANTTLMVDETPTGKTFAVPCYKRYPNNQGTINYYCNADKVWIEQSNECISSWIAEQLINMQDAVNSPQVQQSLENALQNLSSSAINESESIQNQKGIEVMTEIIAIVANASVIVAPKMMENFIQTVDIVVKNTSAWVSATNQSVQILSSVETFAKKLNFSGTFDLTTSSKLSTVQLFGKTVSSHDGYFVNFTLSNLTSDVVIKNNSFSNNSIKVITITYGTMKNIFPQNKTNIINGLVMSTVIGKDSTDSLSKDFEINMTFSISNTSLQKPACVWYDFNSNIWNTSGCTIGEAPSGYVSCSCNHLTSFSILMGPAPADEDKYKFLDIITYAGVAISLFCLLLTLFIEALVWNSVIKNKTSYLRHVCLVNIAVTLLVADIWFIIGSNLQRKSTEVSTSSACKAAAFFTFYFYLSLFFWMLTTGLILFYRMVYILHDMSRKTMLTIAFLLGYGCPLVITVVTVASTEPSGQFTSDRFCWLNYLTSKSFLAFVVPALTIVFINLIILVVVIVKLMRPTVGEHRGQEERKILIVLAKTTAVLTPLLGTTWGFGLGVAVVQPSDPGYLAIHGIFAALNSFQGLFILISTVLLDQKVRMAVRSSLSSSYFGQLRSKGPATTSTSTSEQSRPKPKPKLFRKHLFGSRAVYNLHSATTSTGDAYSLLT